MDLTHVDQLQDCLLFIFDLDGTVYEETAHFQFYGEQLAKRISDCPPDEYLTEVERALGGAHTLSYGSSYDPVHRTIVRGGKVYDWEGKETFQQPSSHLVHVDDPWSVYGVTAAYHGIESAHLQAAFLATRRHMESKQFPMRGMAGLRDAIDKLRQKGRKFVLATNSPEPDSRVILEKLGLTGAFEDYVFNAKKQDRATEHFTRWREKYDIPFGRMVSIGDHYRNEIKPAAVLGMKTIYVDRYIGERKMDVTVQIQHPTQIAAVLEEVNRRI